MLVEKEKIADETVFYLWDSKKVEEEENIPIRNRYPLPELDGNVKLRIVWSTISGEEYIEVDIR